MYTAEERLTELNKVLEYFSNKKEILIALFDSIVERIKDVLDQDDIDDFLKNHKSPSDVENFIRTRVIATVTIIINEPIVIKLIFKDIQGMDDDVVKIVHKSVRKIQNVIVDEIKKLIALQVFRKNLNADVTASMLMGAVMMLIYEYDKANRDILGQESIDAIVENYLSGTFNKISS